MDVNKLIESITGAGNVGGKKKGDKNVKNRSSRVTPPPKAAADTLPSSPAPSSTSPCSAQVANAEVV